MDVETAPHEHAAATHAMPVEGAGLLQQLVAAQHNQQNAGAADGAAAASMEVDPSQQQQHAAEGPLPAAAPAQEQDAATMLLGLSGDGNADDFDAEAAAMQLQLAQQQQLQLLLAQAQAQGLAGIKLNPDGTPAPGQEPQLLSLLQLADGGAGGDPGGDGSAASAAMLAQLGQLGVLQLQAGGQLPPVIGLSGVGLPSAPQLFAAQSDGDAAVGSDEPAAKRARIEGDGAAPAADEHAALPGDDGDPSAAAALQVAALTAEQQVQLQAMLAQDPAFAATLAAGGALGADASASLLQGLVVPEAQPLHLAEGDASAEQLQQLMALQAQILQQGMESGELMPGPDGMLSAEQLHQLQLQTQLAQLQQVQMQQLLLQQLQMQHPGGELIMNADGTGVTLAPAPDAPTQASRGSGSSRGGGGHHHREPAVVRRHGAAPERTITRDSLRELFHLPIEEAAKALNIGQTMLKHYCRKFGIPRWPFRKRQSIGILIQSIEDFSLNRPVNVEPALSKLRSFLHMIDEDPNIDLDGPIKRLRQAFFKEAYKSRQRANKADGGDRSTRAQRNQQRTDQWLEQLCHAIVAEQVGDEAPSGLNYSELEAAAEGMVGGGDAAAAAAMANAQMLEALQAAGGQGATLTINPDGTLSGLPGGGLVFTAEQLHQLQMQHQELERLQQQAGAEGTVLPAAQPLQLPLGPDGEPIQISADGTMDEMQLQQLMFMQQQLALQQLQQLQQQLAGHEAAAAAEAEASEHADAAAAAAAAAGGDEAAVAAAVAAAAAAAAAAGAVMPAEGYNVQEQQQQEEHHHHQHLQQQQHHQHQHQHMQDQGAHQDAAAGAGPGSAHLHPEAQHQMFDAAAMEAVASAAAAHAPPSAEEDHHAAEAAATAAAQAAALAVHADAAGVKYEVA